MLALWRGLLLLLLLSHLRVIRGQGVGGGE